MSEEDEEIEEYDLVEEPETTKITRDKKLYGLDYCPFCGSENLGKDFRKDVMVCFDCRGTWKVE